MELQLHRGLRSNNRYQWTQPLGKWDAYVNRNLTLEQARTWTMGFLWRRIYQEKRKMEDKSWKLIAFEWQWNRIQKYYPAEVDYCGDQSTFLNELTTYRDGTKHRKNQRDNIIWRWYLQLSYSTTFSVFLGCENNRRISSSEWLPCCLGHREFTLMIWFLLLFSTKKDRKVVHVKKVYITANMLSPEFCDDLVSR